MRLRWFGIPAFWYVLLSGLFVSACEGERASTASASLTLAVDPSPPREGPSHISITLMDAEGRIIKGATVVVDAEMVGHSMSPLRARATPSAAGSYESPFVWTMDGSWVMSVTATLADGAEVKRQFALDVAQGQEDMPGAAADVPMRVPNGEAAIRIVSPANGARFQRGDDVRVVIECERFELGEAGNHWHVYVDGGSQRMIMGKINDAVLRDLAPGRHEIATYLSVGSHAELEDGAVVSISISEH